jgi:hypothetical protein
VSQAGDDIRAAHGIALTPAEAEGAAATAKAAAEGLHAEVACLPFGAEAPSYRATLLRLAGKGGSHGRG